MCSFFWFHVRRLLTRTKKVKITQIAPAIGKKTLQELISMFLQCFLANMLSLSASNVHGWIRRNQLFSELIQYCSEFIRVYSTEQNNVSGFISYSHSGGGGQELRVKNNV